MSWPISSVLQYTLQPQGNNTNIKPLILNIFYYLHIFIAYKSINKTCPLLTTLSYNIWCYRVIIYSIQKTCGASLGITDVYVQYNCH